MKGYINYIEEELNKKRPLITDFFKPKPIKKAESLKSSKKKRKNVIVSDEEEDDEIATATCLSAASASTSVKKQIKKRKITQTKQQTEDGAGESRIEAEAEAEEEEEEVRSIIAAEMECNQNTPVLSATSCMQAKTIFPKDSAVDSSVAEDKVQIRSQIKQSGPNDKQNDNHNNPDGGGEEEEEDDENDGYDSSGMTVDIEAEFDMDVIRKVGDTEFVFKKRALNAIEKENEKIKGKRKIKEKKKTSQECKGAKQAATNISGDCDLLAYQPSLYSLAMKVSDLFGRSSTHDVLSLHIMPTRFEWRQAIRLIKTAGISTSQGYAMSRAPAISRLTWVLETVEKARAAEASFCYIKKANDCDENCDESDPSNYEICKLGLIRTFVSQNKQNKNKNKNKNGSDIRVSCSCSETLAQYAGVDGDANATQLEDEDDEDRDEKRKNAWKYKKQDLSNPKSRLCPHAAALKHWVAIFNVFYNERVRLSDLPQQDKKKLTESGFSLNPFSAFDSLARNTKSKCLETQASGPRASALWILENASMYAFSYMSNCLNKK